MRRKRHKNTPIQYDLSYSLMKKILRRTQHPSLQGKIHSYHITDSDRITGIYKVDATEKVCEVTCVSYEIEIEGKWVTVVYFDNTHDSFLHRHLYISLQEYKDTVDRSNLPDTTDAKALLTWALNHLNKNYLLYRQEFVKRSRNYLKEHKIDFY